VAGQYEVDFAGMENACNDAKNHAVAITQILEDMNTQTTASLDYWIGSSKTQYDEAYKWCHDKALALPAAVDAARLTLQNINSTLVDAETSNSKLFANP
jgi:WXG100 family type VII secretion target